MHDEARKDLIPSLVLFALAMILDMGLFTKILTLAPSIYYVLYLFNAIQPRGMYISRKEARNTNFDEKMYSFAHPVLMPSFVYVLLGILYLFFALIFFIIFPVSRYFYHWANVMFGMATGKLEPIPSENTQYSQVRHEPRKTAQTKQPNPQPKARTFTASKGSKTFTMPAFGKTGKKAPIPPRKSSQNARQATQQSIERDLLRSIESNHNELVDIRKNSEMILDGIFGGSKLSKARYLSGLDNAVEMSANNLKAAREYVQVGHNLEILKKYYERSVQTNKAAADLLDSLVTHQQKEQQDDFKEMTSRLDELQDSLKYYETH